MKGTLSAPSRLLLIPGLVMLVACRSSDESKSIDLSADLRLGEAREIELGDETHTFTVLQVSDDRVLLRVESEPVVLAFFLGEPQAVDLDGDGEPDLVIIVDGIEGDIVSVRLLDPTTADAVSVTYDAVPHDPWDIPPSSPPAGELLHELQIVADTDGVSALYDIAPKKDACDDEDPTLFDAYVEQYEDRIRVQHTVGGSSGFPYFEIVTEEQRYRYSACVDQWGHGTMTATTLTLDERVGVDLEGDGDVDVDAVLHRVVMSSGRPTLFVLVYAR